MSVSSLGSKSGWDITMGIKNLTGSIQETFPEVDISDIPGLNPNDPPGANFAVFMFSLIFGMFWITYITFFNSRVVGAIITKIANSFVKDGYIRVRSFTIFISFSSRNQIECLYRLHFIRMYLLIMYEL